MPPVPKKSLPFRSLNKWRWRWMQCWKASAVPGADGIRSAVLHRVARVDKLHDEDWCPVGVEGATVCGVEGELCVPGIFSRMDAPRCKHCCKKLGVPPGEGAPYNSKGEPSWKNA